MIPDHEPHAIVLFDGVCNVCNRYVRFIFDRDPRARYTFAALQSDLGRRLLRQHYLPEGWLGSIVLVEEGRCFTHSAAILRVCKGLTGLWPLLRVLVVVPRPLRDGVYRHLAQHRYRWFGSTAACQIPPPELRQRFLIDATY